jgi:hypothetical protein
MKRRVRSAGIFDKAKSLVKGLVQGKDAVEVDKHKDWLESNAKSIGRVAEDYASIRDFIVPARATSEILHQMTFSGAMKSLRTLSSHLSAIGESAQQHLIEEALNNMAWLYKEMPGLPGGHDREKKLVELFGQSVLMPMFAGVVNMRKNIGVKRASASLVFASEEEALQHLADIVGSKIMIVDEADAL